MTGTAATKIDVNSAEFSKQLTEQIDQKSEQQMEFLSKLVSFDSTRGNEEACQKWLASEFENRNWSVDLFTIDDVDVSDMPGSGAIVDVDYSGALQCVADLGASDHGRSLILQGHIDVVPPGAPELWSQDPYEAFVKEGKLYGRGAADMKSGVSSIVFALDALRDLSFRPAGQVFVETVSEEECTGNGALATLKHGYKADACLIPEPTEHKLLRAELGSVWFRVRIFGKPGHVLSADNNSNAIMSSQIYVDDLLKLTADINHGANSHKYFGDIENPVKFSLGKIRGGDWLGSVPSWCEIECRLSVLPGTPNIEVRDQIRKCISNTAERLDHKEPEVTWIGFKAEGHVFEEGTDAEAVLRTCHEMVLGNELSELRMTATSDTRNYDLYYDIPTLCYGAIGEGLHAPGECVDIESVKKTTAVIALFIARWCGLKEIK